MDTATRIQRIFSEALSSEVPSPTTDIVEAGLLDSLALVTLLFEIEQQFQITIPLDELDIESLRTVEQIAGMVESFTTDDARLDGALEP
jgi:acyl carrier protein